MNAIAREPVASVSRLRPHTEQPTAWIPEGHGPGLDDLLDDFSIENRSLQTRWPVSRSSIFRTWTPWPSIIDSLLRISSLA